MVKTRFTISIGNGADADEFVGADGGNDRVAQFNGLLPRPRLIPIA